MNRYDLGHIYVVIIPLLAAIASISNTPFVEGFRYTGYLWVIMLCLCPFFILYRKTRIRFPVILWFPWFGYVLLSIMWVDNYKLANFQDAVQIFMPLAVGASASVLIRNEWQLRSLRYSFYYSLYIIFGIIIIINFIQIGELGINLRPLALTATLIGCVYVAGFPVNHRRSVIGWSLCLIIAIISKSRMATVALLLIVCICPWHRRIISKISFASITVLLFVGMFYLPVFQERFFLSQSGSLLDLFSGNFSSAGRFEAWPEIWKEAKRNIIFGAGVGESSKFVPKIWPGIGQPHNDYLRIIFELGIVGLSFFIIVVITQIIILQKKIHYFSGEVKYALVSSYLGLIVLLLVAFTDNPITYNLWFMNPLFAILGSTYGVAEAQSRYKITQ